MAIPNIQTDATIGSPQNAWESSVRISHQDGFLHLEGDATAWDDLRFPAQGINPVGLSAPPATDTADPYMGSLLFDPATINVVAGIAQMPHNWKEGSAISPHIHWTPTSTGGGNVVWRFSYMVANINEAFSGSLTVMDPVIAAAGTDANAHLLTSFEPDIDMTGKTISCIVMWKLERVANDGTNDTYAADARLLELDFHYEIDSFGSNAMTTKGL